MSYLATLDSAYLSRFYGSRWQSDYGVRINGYYGWGSKDGRLFSITKNGSTQLWVTQVPENGWNGHAISYLPFNSIPLKFHGLSRDLVWMAHTTGVHKYNSTSGNFDSVHTWPTTAWARIHAITEDDVWAVSSVAVWHWNGSTWTDRTSELSGSPTAFTDVHSANGNVYVLAVDASDGYVYRLSGGSWTLPHTRVGRYDALALWVWGDDEIYIGRGHSSHIYADRWDGTAWSTFDSGYLGSGGNGAKVYCIYSVKRGTVTLGCANIEPYASGGVMYRFEAGGWVKVREVGDFYWGGRQIISMFEMGSEQMGANLRDDQMDADGRYLVSDLSIRDVKVINPSQDPGFGDVSHANFYGSGRDGHQRVAGQKTIPGGDISFGTVAEGLNELAWRDAHDPPPGKQYTKDPNTVYAMDIPSDDVLRMRLTETPTSTSGVWLRVASERRWLIPPGDFELTVDIDFPILTPLATTRVYPKLILYLNRADLRANNPASGDWAYPANGISTIETQILWYDSLAQTRFDSRWYETGTLVQVNTSFASKVTSSKIKTTRVGNVVTQSVWDPSASGGAGAWIGNVVKTIGELFVGPDTPWLQEVAMFEVHAQLSLETGGAGLSDVECLWSNFSLTGVSPVAYDASMNLWLPFHFDQGEATGLPDGPTALVSDRRSVSFVDLENRKLSWRASRSRVETNILPQHHMGTTRLDNYRMDRVDYHDGLLATIMRDGTSTVPLANLSVAAFALIDFAVGEVRRFAPGDTVMGYGGGILGMNANKSSDTEFWASGAARGGLGLDLRGADQLSGPTQWGDMDPISESLPWNCIAGEPRDVAVYRDTDGFAYYFGANTGGLWVTKHRPFFLDQSVNDTNAAHTTTYTVEVISVEIDKTTGNLFWLTAAGAFYYATKATWQAMGEATPNALYYINGFAHTATQTFVGTHSRDSQEKVVPDGPDCWVAADEGVYRSLAGAAFTLHYGVPSSGATHEILPVGTTSVDAIWKADQYLVLACYNSTTQGTNLVIISSISNTVFSTQSITDEVGGLGKRVTALHVGFH